MAETPIIDADTLTPAYFGSQVQYLINQVDRNFEEVARAVDVLNQNQYFLLIHLLVLESIYPKEPGSITYLSTATSPGDVVRGLNAALEKASNFPAQLIELKSQ